MRSARSVVAIAVAVALLVVGAAPAWAKEGARRTARARALFERGVSHFKEGRYDLAMEDFDAGYAVEPLPRFLYNSAQAALKAGQDERALERFRAYLKADPNAPEHDEVVARIAELEKASAKPEPPAPPPVVEKPPPPVVAPPPVVEKPPEREARPTRGLAIGGALLGAGVLLAATGAILYYFAADANATLENPPAGWTFDPSVEDRRDHFQAGGIACLAAGGVSAVAGAVVLGLAVKARARVALVPQPGGVGIAGAF